MQDDTEDPYTEVSPTEDVYSYFMFISPTEQKKEGSAFTTDVIMAWLLIAFNFFFQGVLVYTVFNEVVIENLEWQSGITGSGAGLKLLLTSPGTEPGNPRPAPASPGSDIGGTIATPSPGSGGSEESSSGSEEEARLQLSAPAMGTRD